MLTKQESNWKTSRKAKDKWSARKTIGIYLEDSILYYNNRGDISRGVSKTVPGLYVKVTWATRKYYLRQWVQFVAKLIKELNKMLEIKTKLLMVFYSQKDGQTE